MALSRMEDFTVAIDPRTGELKSASKASAGPRGLRMARGGFNWRPLAIGSAVVLALVACVFPAAVVSELM
ncbi:hypothetical protein HK414_23910 [Ramlibacter terrae]|uniref:Uncharacterized protein n=1 Tax=Ramlibacter terrae TaxID=2732511 RepID=A0ABX6P877_9BURK|nr:hypothetical protein HK414_23910 [Ramlibacter terrae]